MNKFVGRDKSLSSLTDIYEKLGYKRYKPSCFEDYSLYQQNKDFLIGKNVITFTDLKGKLMAMRSDVTLSLIRHAEVSEGSCEKYYYNEKVYRQTSESREFKEINQTGVEIVGSVDELCVTELSLLICKTLGFIDDRYVVELSHVGFTEGLVKEYGDKRDILLDYLRKKNLHDFYALARSENYSERFVKAFEIAVTCSGGYKSVLQSLESACLNDSMRQAVEELKKLCSRLEKAGYGGKINVDFSIANNADYYNGIIFNGYLKNVPQCVLSGGRYDNLLSKFGKKGGAIGFALYLEEIERYFKVDPQPLDYIIIYDDNTVEAAIEAELKLGLKSKRLLLARRVPENANYKKLIDLTAGDKVDD